MVSLKVTRLTRPAANKFLSVSSEIAKNSASPWPVGDDSCILMAIWRHSDNQARVGICKGLV